MLIMMGSNKSKVGFDPESFVELNETNKKKYNLIVEEKIDTTSEYERKMGIFLLVETNKARTIIYKKNFMGLTTYNSIIQLYNACINGLKFESFKRSELFCSRDWNYMHEIEFTDSNILKIHSINIRYDCSSFELKINNVNKESFFNMLSWIKNSLEEFYPELKEGFVSIMIGHGPLEKTYDSLKMNAIFKQKFWEFFNEKYIQDECSGIHSKSRQDKRVFDLIKLLNIKEPKIRIYKILKCLIPGCKIKTDGNAETIEFDQNLLFYLKFSELNKQITYFNDDKNEIEHNSDDFKTLRNFNNLIGDLYYFYEHNENYYELN